MRGGKQLLRPVELYELGLPASLNTLVAGWNTRNGGQTRYQLDIVGDFAALPESLAVALFRITQECLTNIAKHAAATLAKVALTVDADRVTLTIQDNGIANALPFADGPGIGLLGIRERVTALQGHLALAIVQPHGLRVEVGLPILSMTEGQP